MKKFISLSMGFLFLGTSAFASIGETNCSDAHASLRRTEKETWGANHIEWTLNKVSVEAEFIDGTRKEISSSSNGQWVNTLFTQDVTVTEGAGQSIMTVLCESSLLPGALD